MKEIAMSPTTGTPFSIGQGFLAGASAIGLGGLMFYGLGFSNEVGAAEKAMIWPVILLLILTTIHILVYYLFTIYVHAISSYKDHCNFSDTSGPYCWANFEY